MPMGTRDPRASSGVDLRDDVPVKPPSVRTAFWRALRLRCAWCGSRRTFIRRWLGKYERCRTCGLRWRREDGFEFGALALNTVFTFAALAIGMLIGFVASYPDVAVVMPIAIYPLTFTIWFAIDVLTHPPSEEEVAAAAAVVAAGGVPASD